MLKQLLQELVSQGSEGAIQNTLKAAKPVLEPPLRELDIEWSVVEQAVTAGDGAPSLRRVQEEVVKRMVRTEACQQIMAEVRKRAKKSVTEEDVESALMASSTLDAVLRAVGRERVAG